jgi:hypothetical protein
MKKMAFRKFDFASMDNLDNIHSRIGSLATARKVKVAEIVENPDETIAGFRPIKNRYGIKNERSGAIADFCSPIYSVLQHSAAVDMVLGSLKEHGIEARGFMKEWDNGVAVELFLDNVLLPAQGNEFVAHSLRIPDGQDGIQMGIRFVNSYDKSSGFRGYGFGWRLACSNGMFLRSVLPEMMFSVRHTGQVVTRVGDKIYEAIRRLVYNRGALIAVIEEAKKDKVSFATESELSLALSGYVGSERRAENILDNRIAHDVGLETTRWNLYNLLTDYATHTELSVPMYERIQAGAERMLTSQVVLPEAVA